MQEAARGDGHQSAAATLPHGMLSDGARAVARGLRRASLSPGMVGAFCAAIEAAALALGLWFGGYASAETGFAPWGTAGLTAGLALGLVALLWLGGGYRLGSLRRFGPGLLRLLLLAVPLALLAGITPIGTLFVVGFAVSARAVSALIAGAALDFGVTERRAVIVGGGERAGRVLAALAASDSDIRVCGVFDDRDDTRSPPVVRGVPKLGSLADLVAFVRTAEVDMLIVTLPLSADRRIREILKAVEVLPVDVRLSDFADDMAFQRRGDLRAPRGLIGVMSRPLRQRQLIAKRCLDLVGASVALILLAPVLVLTAIAIRMDSPGPVLFRQPRHGYNHRAVDVWKFRSMYITDCDPAARTIVTRGDPRVTRVGRFIRRYSIDELPQLFNVLAGTLSLVGPRPHAVNAVSSRRESFEAIVEGYAARHKVRPGVTGWAQIHGWRGEIDDPVALRRRVEYDLYYIENWSFWLDLRILCLTPFRLLDTRNAY